MNVQELCKARLGAAPDRITPAGGGCIATASRIDLTDGRRVFVKQMSGPDPFAAEALGLKHLKVPGGVRVPEVLHVEPGVLFLEWIDLSSAPRHAQKESQRRLGEQLAQTHRKEDSAYGFPLDHVIGSTPQANLPRVPARPGAWPDFWWTHRLEPMIRRLPSNLRTGFMPLESRVHPLLDGTEESPRILHGDLWSGNAAFDPDGCPVIFDPAPYYGHREADLAMTRMFGGFTRDFYDAYTAAAPLPDGWDVRLDFYMLYHVLNHLILFGNAYLAQARSLLRRV
ncbi:MAG: fructosamine kinase family protein [Verrucomicrobia bacterium]|nr:fructosamine kinase family protein [Verrucomicrobiota bacterium]MCH8525722.1 fructosamine kinase family protein [Kiritimatiellia bacterium]